MTIHVMDSALFGIDFITPEIRDIFDEKAVVESWLLFESILGEVQAELGIIPMEGIRVRSIFFAFCGSGSGSYSRP